MDYFVSSLAIIFSFWAAFQLQIVTFIPAGGLWSIHKFESKRWILRLISIGSMVWFWFAFPLFGGTIAVLLISLILLALSFVIDNTAGFRALNPENIDHVKEQYLADDTIIVGIEMPDGTAVCYPLDEMVVPRHLVNDTIFGVPRLISFCAACRSCMVYDPVIDGKRLTFQVIAVKRRNMVIRDTQTGTLWQQGTGEAIYGAMQGKQLTFLGAQQMKLKDWIADYPDSFIARAKPDAPGGRIPKKVLNHMLKITKNFMAPGETQIGTELPSREKIFGLSLGGYDRAYPVSELMKCPIFEDQFGEEIVQIKYNVDTGKIGATLQKTGEPLILQNHWWFGWKEFHPNTKIWRAK